DGLPGEGDEVAQPEGEGVAGARVVDGARADGRATQEGAEDRVVGQPAGGVGEVHDLDGAAVHQRVGVHVEAQRAARSHADDTARGRVDCEHRRKVSLEPRRRGTASLILHFDRHVVGVYRYYVNGVEK